MSSNSLAVRERDGEDNLLCMNHLSFHTPRNPFSLIPLWVVVSIVFPVCLAANAQNVRWGPFRMNLGFTVGAEFDDNVNTSEKSPKADVKLRLGPTISGGIFLPFAGGQQFTLSLSATYEKSLTGNDDDSFGAPMAATLTLPIYIQEWTVVLSDSFSFTNDPLEQTFAYNRNQATEYSNTAFLSATRQMGKFAATIAASRNDTFYPDDPDQEETIYQFSFTPAFFLREGYSIFWRNSYAITELADPTQRDVIGYSSEVGLSGQITPSLAGSISAGWSHSELEATKTNGVDHIDGISSSIALSYTHPLRPNTSHSISFFRSPGVTAVLKDSNITETIGVTYSLAHRLNRYITIVPTVSWSNLKDIGGGGGEKADIWDVGFGLSRAFTQHLSGSLAYRYQTRSSNLPDQSYDVNRVTVDFNYTF